MMAPALPEIERTLEEVLARPEFRQGGTTLLQRILTAIGNFFEELFSFLTGHGQGVSVWSVVLLLAVLAAVVFGVVRVLRRHAGGKRKRSVRQAGRPLPETPEAMLLHADSLAAAGDYLHALVMLLAALLMRLQAEGLLYLEAGRTNRQYLNDLRRSGRKEAGLFGDFCLVFNRIRYGGQAAGREDYAYWRRVCMELPLQGKAAAS